MFLLRQNLVVLRVIVVLYWAVHRTGSGAGARATKKVLPGGPLVWEILREGTHCLSISICLPYSSVLCFCFIPSLTTIHRCECIPVLTFGGREGTRYQSIRLDGLARLLFSLSHLDLSSFLLFVQEYQMACGTANRIVGTRERASSRNPFPSAPLGIQGEREASQSCAYVLCGPSTALPFFMSC